MFNSQKWPLKFVGYCAAIILIGGGYLRDCIDEALADNGEQVDMRRDYNNWTSLSFQSEKMVELPGINADSPPNGADNAVNGKTHSSLMTEDLEWKWRFESSSAPLIEEKQR